MGNLAQQTSDQFWQTHFPQLVDKLLDERTALDIEFWDQLQNALETEDIDTLDAIMLAKPAVKITTGDMYVKIVKMAKRMWDKKRSSFYNQQSN